MARLSSRSSHGAAGSHTLNDGLLDLSSDATSFTVATGSVPVLGSVPVSRYSPAVRSILSEIEDGRSFSPQPDLERSVRTTKARVFTPQTRATGAASRPTRLSAISFEYPVRVIRCIRRKIRRQVILAKGKGGGRHKRPRRRASSNIWC